MLATLHTDSGWANELLSFTPTLEVQGGVTDNVNLVTPGRSGAYLKARPRIIVDGIFSDRLLASLDLDSNIKYYSSAGDREIGNRAQIRANTLVLLQPVALWELGLAFSPSYTEGNAPIYTTTQVHPILIAVTSGSQKETYHQIMGRLHLRFAPELFAVELGAGLKKRTYSTITFDIIGNQYHSDFSEPILDLQVAYKSSREFKLELKSTLEWRDYREQPTSDAFGLPLSLSQSPGPVKTRSHSHTLLTNIQLWRITFISNLGIRIQKDLRSSAEDFMSIKLGEEITLPLNFSLTPQFAISYEKKDYSAFRADSANNPETQALRSDKILQFKLSLKYAISGSFDLISSYAHRKIISNYYGQEFIENSVESGVRIRM